MYGYYNFHADKSWQHYNLFEKAIRVKYKIVNGKRVMVNADSNNYDKQIMINTTAYLADAVKETKEYMIDYIYNFLIGDIKEKNKHVDGLRDINVPDIFDIYEGKKINNIKYPILIPGKQMVRYTNLINNLIDNGYIRNNNLIKYIVNS